MAGNPSLPSDIASVFSPPFRARLSILNPDSPSIRRSLSRSPSKTPRRLVSSRSASPRANTPLSPICGSPTERSRSTSLLPTIKRNVQNCFGTPRTNRKRTSHIFVWEANSEESTACREERHGPLERTLSERTDNGNATPHSSGSCSDDIENQSKLAIIQDDPALDTTTKRKSSDLFEGSGHPRTALERLEKGGSLGRFAAKSSPLKRSDGFMNLDHSYLGSPSAKRRSLHGVHLGSGFNIFDQAAEEEKSQDLDGNGNTMDTSSSPDQTTPSHTPRKSSSLRRSMQPRQEKPSFVKSRLHAAVADVPASPVNHNLKDRFRMSLDNHLPPQIPHDSPFSSQGALPSASIHPVSQVQNHVSIFTKSQNGRHPLTRQLSQSSTSSLMTDDSPTHFPSKQVDNRRKYNDFARSLPLGSRRPASSDASTQGQSSQGYSVDGSFSTPENYKAARPLAQAFMSTGLISKRHRNQPDTQGDLNAERSIMPDTPCKRQPFTSIPTPAIAKDSEAQRDRASRHSFGTPSTPMHTHTHNINLASLGKNVSIFGSSIRSIAASRPSLFSTDRNREGTTSPSRNFLRRQVSSDSDLPPTPTKATQSPWTGKGQYSTVNRGETVIDIQEQIPWLVNKSPNAKFEPTCKLLSPLAVPEEVKDLESNEVQQSPPPASQFRSHFPVPLSLTRSRSARFFQTPAPLQRTSNTFPLLKVNAKSIHLSTAGPISELCERLSPRTPQEAHTPPDPSRLSISAVANGEPDLRLGPQARRLSMGPPETPTAVKDFALNSSIFASSVTPTAASRVAEIDPCLTARFDKVEPLGGGDFSRVYKVSKPKNSKTLIPHFSRSAQQHPQTDPRTVWAVKRSVTPYMGNRDRERRLQEVYALKAMGKSEHIIHLIDHWEEKGHLYIQTEYCEEGTLQGFVNQAGRYARLDDFRIWKILVELATGLKHLHDRSYLHLDLKPANILITFEGVLKIADFGMATPWPVTEGSEVEGDREYIAPEVLRGVCDKPTDVYTLGLIMVEIAGNVVLPDNGAAWQKLRSGDFSDVPSLIYSVERDSTISRDSSGNALSRESSQTNLDSPMFGKDDDSFKTTFSKHDSAHSVHPIIPHRESELAEPPSYMLEEQHPDSLNTIVRCLISQDPGDRLTADQILHTRGALWTESRRRAGATIFEGNWGPADEQLADDAEMIDV